MMKSYEHTLIYVGLLTLIIGAVLGFVAVLLVGVMPSIDQTRQWAEVVSSKPYITSYYLLIYAYLIPIPGFWALHRLFAQDKTSYLLSFWGMILSILGSALPMASMGVSAFAFPALGRAFLHHGSDIVPLTTNVFTSGVMIFLLFSGLYYLTGIILFGMVLWRHQGRLLKIAGVSLIAHGLLIILPTQVFINLTSWGCLFVSAILFIVHARHVFRNQAPAPA